MSNAPYPYEATPVGPTGPVPVRRRNPLGLPAGSVRALLILMVMGTIIILLLMPRNVAVPLYLWYLLFLTVGVYFGARGKARSHDTPPLYLPKGTIRILIIAGFFGIMGYAVFRDPSAFYSKPMLSDADKKESLLMPTVMVAAFLFGVIVNAIAGKVLKGAEGMPAWYQDVQAWVSVLAVLGLGGQILLEVIVFPTMAEPPSLPQVQGVLSAVVAFYFGQRV